MRILCLAVAALGLLGCTDAALDHSYIVDGEEADIREAPFMVALDHGFAQDRWLHWCGGAYLGGKWVVTAAHCVQDFPADFTLGVLFNTTSYTDRFEVDTDHDTMPGFTARPPGMVDTVGTYANEAWARTGKDGDVALIELASVPAATPIPLLSAGDEPIYASRGHEGRIFGWGQARRGTSHEALSSDPNHLRAAEVAIGSDDDLAAIGDSPAEYVPLLETSGTACYGDSGGPAVVFAANGAPTLVGVLSHTNVDGCGSYVAATRLRNYDAWIAQTIADHGGW